MANIKGIDISRWQGPNFDIAAAKKAGAEYVIMRIMTGEFPGNGMDSQFENYYKQCKTAGMPCGAYVFGNATTVEQARAEAKEAIKYLSDRQFEYPIYYDVESGAMMSVDRRTLTNIVKAFCEELESAGYFVGIYASTSVFNNKVYDDELGRYTHWVADWRGNKPVLNSNNQVGIWQTGSIKNWQGNIEVDQDICYISDFPGIIKGGGFNGYAKTQSIRNEISIELTAAKTAISNIEKLISKIGV